MAVENVGSILQALSENNARIAIQTINGYRSASGSVLQRLHKGFKTIQSSAPKRRRHGKAQRALGMAGERLTTLCATAVEKLSHSAAKAIGSVEDQTSAVIEKVGANVAQVAKSRAAPILALVGNVSVPPLKLARDVSAWIAARTEGRQPSVLKRAMATKSRNTVKRARK
jgi:hypothetical protein